jgi:hypothetical protein
LSRNPYVVLDSFHNASCAATISVIIDIAGAWWVVLGVNEVVWLRVLSGRCVFVGIRLDRLSEPLIMITLKDICTQVETLAR